MLARVRPWLAIPVPPTTVAILLIGKVGLEPALPGGLANPVRLSATTSAAIIPFIDHVKRRAVMILKQGPGGLKLEKVAGPAATTS